MDNSKPAASPLPLEGKKANPQTSDEITTAKLEHIGISTTGGSLGFVLAWQKEHYCMADIRAAIAVALTHERTPGRTTWRAKLIDIVLRDPANAEALRKHLIVIAGAKCAHCGHQLTNGSTHLRGGSVCNDCHGAYMRNEWVPPALATTHPPMP